MSDGYTHDPDGFDETGDRNVDSGSGDESTGGAPTGDPGRQESVEATHPEAVERDFDWRGWTVVAGVFVAFLVIPGIIYLYPHVGPMFGLTFWDTYLALPMVPAVLLAVLAVWATTRP